jgi:hypothetical protein
LTSARSALPSSFQNFLEIFLAALAARGLANYVVAAEVTNIDATPAPGIRITDHDVLLVDEDRVEWNPATVVAAIYAANVGPVAPGVSLIRGFVIIDATIDGEDIRIANTHLESGSGGALSGLRALQAGELLSHVGTASPAILLGDFNDSAGVPCMLWWEELGSATYGQRCGRAPGASPAVMTRTSQTGCPGSISESISYSLGVLRVRRATCRVR